MTPTRTTLGAAAFAFALAGGGLAGAALGTPTLSNAQDASTSSTTAADDASPGGRFGHRGQSLEVAAEALGMTAEELRAELADGKSIAQVAEAEGVDLQTVIDALVADGTTRLEAAIAALPDRVTEMVNRTGWGEDGPGGHHGPRGHGGFRIHGLEAAADAIGITPDELRTALQDGSTIAEVAEANDVDVDAVIEALVADATAKLDEAVANGRISAERAETMKAALTERITAHVNGEDPGPPVDGDLDDVD